MPDFVHPAVAGYLSALTAPEDDILAGVRRRSREDGVPAISADSAALLRAAALSAVPRRILEIGTGYGCSAILLARTLTADGLLFTIERDPARAAVARELVAQAGVADRVNVMVGEAARLVHKVAGPFDVILQDGSKDQYEPLLDRLVALLRPRGILVSDNILWRGDAVPGFRDEPVHSPESISAVSSYNHRLAADTRLATLFLPVGDGVAISVRLDPDGRAGASQ